MKSFLKKYYASLGRFRALYLISAIEMCIIVIWSTCTKEGVGFPDTETYYEAYDVIISGKVDIRRTPLYPLFIGLCRMMFGMPYSFTVVFFLQSILFLVSIKWMGRLLESITDYRRLSYGFTAVYALYPGILSFCGCILTESLTISLVTGLIYYVSEGYFNNSCRKAALSGIMSLFLWMLRPSLIALTLLLMLFWGVCLLFCRKNGTRTYAYGFTTALLSLICLGAYSIAYRMESGTTGITYVSTENNYMLIRGANVINVDEIEAADIRNDMDSIMRVNGASEEAMDELWWTEIYNLSSKHDRAEVHNFIQAQIKKHPEELIPFLINKRLRILLKDDCIHSGGPMPIPLNIISNTIHINNSTVFIILLIGIALLIANYINHRRTNFFLWFLILAFASNYILVWVGAPNDYPRLLAQNYPVLIAVSCWIFDRLCTLVTSDNTKGEGCLTDSLT